MRSPARQKTISKGQVANIVNLSAPVGGWNAIDGLANMKPDEAVWLDNWYPNLTDCEKRGGYIEHASGMSGDAKTLAVYNALNGASQIFCLTDEGVFDVSSSGTVGASEIARTDGKHVFTMFGDGTNNYLILCNGVDKPLYYDGTNWLAVDDTTSPALTGITTTSLSAPIVFKGRLLFIEKNSLSFWYLSAGAAGGALTEFPMDGIAKHGGQLIAGESWSVDAGDGMDDNLVFVTSEGEVIVYQGTDPSSASTWALVGTYQIGKPLGKNCIFKYASELLFLTKQGGFPLTTVFNAGGMDFSKSATRKIQRVFNESAALYGNTYGWKVVYFPVKSAIIINVPIAENGIHHQYVMNTSNNSWCRFIGWNAEDFAILGDEIYFCSGTETFRAWYGSADNGGNIELYGKCAFSYLGPRGVQKHIKLARGIFTANGAFSYLFNIDTDFEDTEVLESISASKPTSTLWGTAVWGADTWGSATSVQQKDWYTPSAFPGYALSGKIKISDKSLDIQWQGMDYILESGSGF